MTPHDTFLDLAAIAIDFPLAPSERDRLEQHLARCPACARRASALRGDAVALGHLPAVILPERRGAEILAGALHPNNVRHPLRLLVLAALLALLLVGSLAVGAQLLRSPDDDLSVVVPVPSGTTSPDASVRPSAIPAPSSSAVPAPGRLVVTQDVNGTDWIELVSLDQTVTRLAEGRDPAWLSTDLIVYFCPTASPDFLGICTVNPGSPGSVHSLMADADRPAPAPDGRSIAFHRGTIDVGSTWIIEADGSGLRQLSTGAFRQWSPDGAWLVGQPESATAQVAIVKADGTGLRVLAPGYDPVWSPTGTRIAYAVVEGKVASLRTVDAATGEVTVLYEAPADVELTAPAWLAGDRLVFVQGGDLWRLDAGSSTPVRLSTGLAIPALALGDPLEVSPDSSWIAFASGSGADAEVGIASVESDTQIALPRSGPVTQPRWEPRPAVEPTSSASPGPGASTQAPVGRTWVEASVPAVANRPAGRIEAVAAGGPGFVAVGRGCTSTANGDLDRCEGLVWTSTDGRTWTLAPASDATDIGTYLGMSGPETGMFDVAAGGPGIVAIGYSARPKLQATVWFSHDAVSWVRIPLGLQPPATTPGGLDAARVKAVAWDGRQFVIVGEDRSPAGGSLASMLKATARAAVWASPDGRTWTRVPHTPVFDVGGFIDTQEDPASGGMADVVAGPGGLVAVGSVCHSKPVIGCEAAAWTSPDGVAWSRAADAPAPSGVLKAIATDGASYVAVGAQTCDSSPVAIPQPCPPLILTSSDGSTWAAQQAIDQSGDLRTVARIGDRFFATAPDGPATVWTSADGTAWDPADQAGGPATSGRGSLQDWHFAATPGTAVWLGTPNETDAPAAWVSGR